MRTIVAGSRTITDLNVVADAIRQSVDLGLVVTQVICGCAQGVDTIGAALAKVAGIPVVMMPADWNAHGLAAAGPIRNRAMAAVADAAIVVWTGSGGPSKGSASMIAEAKAAQLDLYVFKSMERRAELVEYIHHVRPFQ